MKTPARPRSSVRRQVAFAALSVLAIIAVPVVARAACGAQTHRIALPGRHQVDAHVANPSFQGAHASRGAHGHGRQARVHEHSPGVDGFRWSLHDGEFRSNCGVSPGELQDAIGSVGRGGDFLWISQDGDEWLIRDRALIQRARVSVEPMERLGKEMGRLGGEMGRLGAQQGRFGAELGRLGARQGALAARLALLEIRDHDDDPAIEREIAALEREVEELSRRQDSSVEGRMDEVGAQMDDLGGQMDQLGDRMEELSRRAARELKALAKDAIASRRAERVGHRSGR